MEQVLHRGLPPDRGSPRGGEGGVAPLLDDRTVVVEESGDIGAGQEDDVGVYEKDVITGDLAMRLQLGDLLTDVVYAEEGRGDAAFRGQVSQVVRLTFWYAHDDFIPAFEVLVNGL